MDRRTVLTSSAALLAGTAGCSALDLGNDSEPEPEQVELTGVFVTNETDAETSFDVSVVRDGSNYWLSQLDIPPGKTRRSGPRGRRGPTPSSSSGCPTSTVTTRSSD